MALSCSIIPRTLQSLSVPCCEATETGGRERHAEKTPLNVPHQIRTSGPSSIPPPLMSYVDGRQCCETQKSRIKTTHRLTKDASSSGGLYLTLAAPTSLERWWSLPFIDFQPLTHSKQSDPPPLPKSPCIILTQNSIDHGDLGREELSCNT